MNPMSSGRGKELTLPAWMTASSVRNDISTQQTLPMQPLNQNPQYWQPHVATTQTPIFNPVNHVANVPLISANMHSSIQIQPPHRPIMPINSSTTTIDPNNDVSAWSEHQMEDGKKFWFNRILGTSTYDKPFVLKSPEERSIPPCKWKEYTTNDGRKYYSDGNESVWTMPDEFKVWQEKVELVSKKIAPPPPPAPNVSFNESLSKLDNTSTKQVSSLQLISENRKETHKLSDSEKLETTTAIVYSTKEDAKAAFINLLSDKNISSSLKFSQVSDICQNDPRWNALKSIGEKKQNIAEYQTKTLKLEKEQQRMKEKKNKGFKINYKDIIYILKITFIHFILDAFLLMLAERVEIDFRTRWRDAVEYLQMDQR